MIWLSEVDGLCFCMFNGTVRRVSCTDTELCGFVRESEGASIYLEAERCILIVLENAQDLRLSYFRLPTLPLYITVFSFHVL